MENLSSEAQYVSFVFLKACIDVLASSIFLLGMINTSQKHTPLTHTLGLPHIERETCTVILLIFQPSASSSAMRCLILMLTDRLYLVSAVKL
jgi:hypothetical protein